MTNDNSDSPGAEERRAALVLDMLPGGAAEFELDLRGVDIVGANRALERMLDRMAPAPRSVAVLLDPPLGDGTETLFLPVGRHLRNALAAGRITSCRPIAPAADSGPGFLVTIPAKTDPDDQS